VTACKINGRHVMIPTCSEDCEMLLPMYSVENAPGAGCAHCGGEILDRPESCKVAIGGQVVTFVVFVCEACHHSYVINWREFSSPYASISKYYH
jgi:hypothetical protein